MTNQQLRDMQASQILVALDAIGPGEKLELYCDETGRMHVRISIYCRVTDETISAIMSGSSARDVLAQAAQVLS